MREGLEAPDFLTDYGRAFAYTGHFGAFYNYGVFSDPGSLIEIMSSVWVELNNIDLLNNLMFYTHEINEVSGAIYLFEIKEEVSLLQSR